MCKMEFNTSGVPSFFKKAEWSDGEKAWGTLANLTKDDLNLTVVKSDVAYFQAAVTSAEK